MIPIAKILIIAGLIIAALGVIMLVFGRVPWLGRLPGDISMQGKSVSFHFPIVTCLILSLLLTVILNLFLRGR